MKGPAGRQPGGAAVFLAPREFEIPARDELVPQVLFRVQAARECACSSAVCTRVFDCVVASGRFSLLTGDIAVAYCKVLFVHVRILSRRQDIPERRHHRPDGGVDDGCADQEFDDSACHVVSSQCG